MTLAYNAPKCCFASASASASVDVAVGANAQRARLYGHMPLLATCCCSVCQENRSSVLRVYSGLQKKRKNLKSYKYTDPKFETNFESSSSTLKVKTSIQIQRKLQKTIAVFLACVCVCCQVLSITVNIQLTDCMPDKHDMPSHRYQLYNNTPIDSPADPHTHQLLT